ncbi:MAG: uracil-DNA glycosylase [Oscillospiraceae bacterium]|nr:uracil-DNA glycosylase [Oscillospiraceae bacterium]
MEEKAAPFDWDGLENECRACTKCPLCGTRSNVVFGAGRRDAKILLVGEAPGANEDAQGLPFVGKAGNLLDDMLKIIGLGRDKNVYITNIIKCRPPGNRDPSPSEREMCLPWLRAQFALMRPQLTICLGRISATALISEDFKITRDHGKWFEKGDSLFTALFHPSALLRDPRRRPETFVDLKDIQKRMTEIGCIE